MTALVLWETCECLSFTSVEFNFNFFAEILLTRESLKVETSQEQKLGQSLSKNHKFWQCMAKSHSNFEYEHVINVLASAQLTLLFCY